MMDEEGHGRDGDASASDSQTLLVNKLATVKLSDDDDQNDNNCIDDFNNNNLKKRGKEERELVDSPMSDSDIPNATPLSDATSISLACSPRQRKQGQSFLNDDDGHDDEEDDHLTPLINLDDSDEPSSCPATRAMEASQAIACNNEQLIREELLQRQQQQQHQEQQTGQPLLPPLEQSFSNISLTPKVKNSSFLEMSFSREETLQIDNRTGHDDDMDDNNIIEGKISSSSSLQQKLLQESRLFIPSQQHAPSVSSSQADPFPPSIVSRQQEPPSVRGVGGVPLEMISSGVQYDNYNSSSNNSRHTDNLISGVSEAATNKSSSLYTFSAHTLSGKVLTLLSTHFVPSQHIHTHGGSALAGFAALLLVTCANYMLGPMRDAAALAVGVTHIPALTLVSTVLALGSSVPVGWLFEAPDPRRRRVWKRMGLTRGETQGTSLALFYRVFAFLLLSYALGFQMVERLGKSKREGGGVDGGGESPGIGEEESAVILLGCLFLRILGVLGIPTEHPLLSSIHDYLKSHQELSIPSLLLNTCSCVVNKFGKVIYIMFFLVVHLMKLHSLSLIWGVTTEAMEYEENAEQRRKNKEKNITKISSGGGLVMMGGSNNSPSRGGSSPSRTRSSSFSSSRPPSKSSLRLKRLAFVGFGGTLGGILGSVIASFTAHILHLSGLLVVAAIMLEISANLSIELGRIMQRHWEEQMQYQSSGDLASMYNSTENLAACDSSMKKSVSLSSMKRVASGSLSSGNLANLAAQQQSRRTNRSNSITGASTEKDKKALTEVAEKLHDQPIIDDNSFKQRLLRGITTILRSRLLMAIFTYNALYASTSVLLSFQRAELVANRSSSGISAVSNTAFLAKINTASSVAVFALQASGLGAYIANSCGQRGALALMPIIRLCGVILLGWWHWNSDGKPPDLILFLVIDEFTKVINFAIAKPVRENLWRGLSAEARYEAKPIVDTLANRWGGGSAAFLVSFINRITDLTGLGVVKENGERSIFGFPPVLLLCMIISAWWTAVSADVGNIRRKIDLELKKQQ